MDPYDILNASRESNISELRRAYKKALLNNHPDTSKGEARHTIDQVNKAYKTILDKNNAPDYHTVLTDVQFSDMQDLAEFEFNEPLQQFSHPCRCGQDMILSADELEANGDADEIAVQCTGCSLWVLVQYEVEY